MKTCTKCGETKPLDQFFARKGASDGRMSSCKACKTAAIYAWREKNAERWREYVRAEVKRPHRAAKRSAYRELEDVRERTRAREATPEVRAKRRAYLEANPEKAAAYNKNRAARRRARMPIGTVSACEWAAIQARHGGRCRYCGIKPARMTMDHIVPISAGGRHEASNIAPACISCNARKKDAMPEQFALRMGRLCW